MKYNYTLPKMKTIRMLASEVEEFPITGLGIVQYAEHLGYDDDTVNFLKLFSSRMVFNSKTDLLYHCSLLERLLKEEFDTPAERLLSPQD